MEEQPAGRYYRFTAKEMPRDVREDFREAQWSHNRRVLVLAIEYKKIFMNEWTGELYQDVIDMLIRDFNRAVDSAVETCLSAL